ncbi:hypothetical protein EBR57_03325 [bacterium]|nr:hypothetical protein [bacterium]
MRQIHYKKIANNNREGNPLPIDWSKVRQSVKGLTLNDDSFKNNPHVTVTAIEPDIDPAPLEPKKPILTHRPQG